MLAVGVKDGPVVEELLVNDAEIGAVGLHEQVFGSFHVGLLENDFHLNVVEHTDDSAQGVVAYRLNAE